MSRPDSEPPAQPPAKQPDNGPAKWFVFPRRDPTREGRLMGAVRMVWNFILSAIIGVAVGGFGSQFVGDAATAMAGELPYFWRMAIAALGWIAGGGTAFVSFMSYYLDDSEG